MNGGLTERRLCGRRRRPIEDRVRDLEERGQRRRGIIGAPDDVGLEQFARLAERESDDARGEVVRDRLGCERDRLRAAVLLAGIECSGQPASEPRAPT